MQAGAAPGLPNAGAVTAGTRVNASPHGPPSLRGVQRVRSRAWFQPLDNSKQPHNTGLSCGRRSSLPCGDRQLQSIVGQRPHVRVPLLGLLSWEVYVGVVNGEAPGCDGLLEVRYIRLPARSVVVLPSEAAREHGKGR